jgi:hypothetical protein
MHLRNSVVIIGRKLLSLFFLILMTIVKILITFCFYKSAGESKVIAFTSVFVVITSQKEVITSIFKSNL